MDCDEALSLNVNASAIRWKPLHGLAVLLFIGIIEIQFVSKTPNDKWNNILVYFQSTDVSGFMTVMGTIKRGKNKGTMKLLYAFAFLGISSN